MRPLLLTRLLTTVVTILLTGPSGVHAQVGDSFAELMTRIRIGDTVTVLDAGPREVTGKVVEVSGSSLTVSVDGDRRGFSPSTTRQIWRRGDSLRNGLAIGTIVGLLVGGFIGPRNADETLSFFPAGGLLGALGGLGVGAGLDAAVKGKQPVYGADAAPRAGYLGIAPAVSSAGAVVTAVVRF